MNRLALEGARRGQRKRASFADSAHPCPQDGANGSFKAQRLNQWWVSDFTHVHLSRLVVYGHSLCRIYLPDVLWAGG